MKNFMVCSSNKQQSIDLFAHQLVIDGIQVKLATSDADMLMVKGTLHEAETHKTVVVHSVDTDVFIALTHHFNKDTHNRVLMETKKGFVSIGDVALKQVKNEMQECLPVAHVISGCDTVSATYGLGKLRVYRKLSKSQYWRNQMSIVGDDDTHIEDMIEVGETFYLELYGKLGEKANSLDNLREMMHSMPKYIPISRMPPTSRAFHFHMLGTHLEVNNYKNL